MEFQNEPFRELKDRVDTLEKAVEVALDDFEARIKALENPMPRYGYVQVGASEPEKVREKQDDERRKPFLKAVGKVQKTDEQDS